MSNPVHWVYENGIFDRDEEFLEALKRHGNSVSLVDYLKYIGQTEYILDSTRACKYGDEPVMFRGSLNLSRIIRQDSNWVPGTYLNEKYLDCTYYYAKFGKYLLNRDYMIMPLVEVTRRKEDLLDYFRSGNKVFIRPTSNMKRFHAGVFDIYREYSDFKSLSGHLRSEDTELVLVAAPQNIKWEARLFMYKNTVVTGSVYRYADKEKLRVISPVCGITAWANNLISKINWWPDTLWSLDICAEGKYGDLKVLEIGSYGLAGEYACNIDLYIEAANHAALEDWKQYFE